MISLAIPPRSKETLFFKMTLFPLIIIFLYPHSLRVLTISFLEGIVVFPSSMPHNLIILPIAGSKAQSVYFEVSIACSYNFINKIIIYY